MMQFACGPQHELAPVSPSSEEQPTAGWSGVRQRPLKMHSSGHVSAATRRASLGMLLLIMWVHSGAVTKIV